MIARRSFLTGLGSLLAAPAIVRASSLMPISSRAVLRVDEFAALDRMLLDTREFLEGMSQRCTYTIWYGESGQPPNFAGFVARYPGMAT